MRKFLLVIFILFLNSLCYAEPDYLQYVARMRDHFGVKAENKLGMDERFFIGADIGDLGESIKACAEKDNFLSEKITIGVEAQDAFYEESRYKQQTPGLGGYIYLRADEFTKFSTEFKYSEPEIYHLADIIDPAVKRYQGKNDVAILLFRCENYPVDNEDYPKSGRKSDLDLEVSSKGMGSGFNFLRTNAQTAFYYTPKIWIFENPPLDDITFVINGRAGWITKYGSEDEIPFFERFYAGGTGTVRGYKFRYLAPRDIEDLPIGGNCVAVVNLEMRYPVYRDIKGAIFYDQGNAWNKTRDMNITDTKAGIGTGLRWVTPLGVARLDYGYGLNSGTREKNGRVHLSLGMKF